MTKPRLIAAALVALACGSATAASLPAPVEAAIADAETRVAAAKELRFTFRMHSVGAEHDVRLTYDPSRPEVWTAEPPLNEATTKMQERMAKRAEQQESPPDRELLTGELRKLFGEKIELVENGPDERVYRFDISKEAEIGGGGGRFDAAKYLKGEIAVGADDRLLWLRFYAPETFKPALVARVDSFDMKLHYEPIWEDGPYVMVRQAIDLSGSAFFRSFEENANTVYSGFEKR